MDATPAQRIGQARRNPTMDQMIGIQRCRPDVRNLEEEHAAAGNASDER